MRIWLPAILWAALIFTISSLPASSIEEIQNRPDSILLRFLLSDPVGHLVEYAIFGYLLSNAFMTSFSGNPKKMAIFWAVGVGIAFALIDELHQIFVPGRGFEVVDLLFDVAGLGFPALAGVVRKGIRIKLRLIIPKILIILVVLTSNLSYGQENLLVNPSFEKGWEGWARENYANNLDTFTTEWKDAHDGSFSFKVARSGGQVDTAWYILSESIRILGGKSK